MAYIVQYSTGLGSAEVARRLVNHYGVNNVILLTADTRVEDPDNWRFAHEVVNKLMTGIRWVTLADGRTPMQVGRDMRLVPNDRMAVCSRVLKRELLRKWIDANCDPAEDVVALGFDWTEPKRLEKAIPMWEPWQLICPMMDEPLVEKWSLYEFYRDEIGIKPPRLYDVGFAHANCGGACVRAGQAAWKMLLDSDRDTYLKWEAEEEATRALLGKDVTILVDQSKAAKAANGGKRKPIPLRVFRERVDGGGAYDCNDFGVCGCDPFNDDWEQESLF